VEIFQIAQNKYIPNKSKHKGKEY